MKAILAIGSNCGDREENILKGLSLLSLYCSIVRKSEIFESADIQGHGQQYLNMVLEVKTVSDAFNFNNEIKRIEKTIGRDEHARAKGEVPVDIDIVIWENTIVRPTDYHSDYFKRGLEGLK